MIRRFLKHLSNKRKQPAIDGKSRYNEDIRKGQQRSIAMFLSNGAILHCREHRYVATSANGTQTDHLIAETGHSRPLQKTQQRCKRAWQEAGPKGIASRTPQRHQYIPSGV